MSDLENVLHNLVPIYNDIDIKREKALSIINNALGLTMQERFTNANELERLFRQNGLLKHCNDIASVK